MIREASERRPSAFVFQERDANYLMLHQPETVEVVNDKENHNQEL